MLKKIIFGLLIVVLILLITGIVAMNYFATNGKAFLQCELKKNLGVEPKIGNLQIIFPSSIVINNFDIGSNLHIDKIIASPSILGLIRGDVILNSLTLVKPRIKMVRNNDETFDFGVPLADLTIKAEEAVATAPVVSPGQKTISKKRKSEFHFDRLKIIDAVIEFLDKSMSETSPFRAQISGFNMDVFHPSMFKLSEFQFQGRGIIEAETFQKIADIELSGTADILTRNGNAQATLANIYLPYLGSYYKKFLKKELKSGNMMLSAKMVAENNDLKADCHVELSGIVFKEVPPEQVSAEGIDQPTDLTVLAFDSMLSSRGSAIFDFSIATKMDNPKFEHIKIKGSFLQNRIQDALANPEKTAETFMKIGKDYKAIGKEFKKIFKGE